MYERKQEVKEDPPPFPSKKKKKEKKVKKVKKKKKKETRKRTKLFVLTIRPRDFALRSIGSAKRVAL